MPIDLSQVQSFTDAELLLIYRQALAQGGFRQSYTYNGRQIQIPGSAEVMAIISYLESRVSAATNGDTSLVCFDSPI